MKEAQIKSVALFFFYTFIDKSLSFKAAGETIHLIEKRIKNRDFAASDEPLIIHFTYKIWKKYSKRRNIKTDSLSLSGEGWVVPTNLKLEPWRQFVKDTDPQVYLSVIWSQLLQLSDKSISEGLGISEGSVRYRVGKGLKTLGQLAGPMGGLDA